MAKTGGRIFDYGRYRHIGHVTERTSFLPNRGLAVDAGVRVTLSDGAATETISYGHAGLVEIQMEWLSFDRVHVFNSSGAWNEIWQLVPDGELLPQFFSTRPWDGRCGSFGLRRFRPSHIHPQFRCTIPSDLALDVSEEFAAHPLVWLGGGRIEEIDELSTGMHLGWQLAPPDGSPIGAYAAADICPNDHPAGCLATDLITMEIIGPDPPADHDSIQYANWLDSPYRQQLYVIGPGTWQLRGNGMGWRPPIGLSEDSALPLPTPVCLECPD